MTGRFGSWSHSGWRMRVARIPSRTFTLKAFESKRSNQSVQNVRLRGNQKLFFERFVNFPTWSSFEFQQLNWMESTGFSCQIKCSTATVFSFRFLLRFFGHSIHSYRGFAVPPIGIIGGEPFESRFELKLELSAFYFDCSKLSVSISRSFEHFIGGKEWISEHQNIMRIISEYQKWVS